MGSNNRRRFTPNLVWHRSKLVKWHKSLCGDRSPTDCPPHLYLLDGILFLYSLHRSFPTITCTQCKARDTLLRRRIDNYPRTTWHSFYRRSPHPVCTGRRYGNSYLPTICRNFHNRRFSSKHDFSPAHQPTAHKLSQRRKQARATTGKAWRNKESFGRSLK